MGKVPNPTKEEIMNINSSSSLYGVSAFSTQSSSSSSNTNSLSSKFAEELLTSMDSDSSGSIDSAEFSSAALKLSSSSSTSDASSTAAAFSALDSNQDGVVSMDELTGAIESIIGQQGTMAAGGPPPPPPSNDNKSSEDTGYTQEELTAMASDTTSTDSKLTSLFETLAKNFDSADTNSDGKVTSAEAMAYKESTKETSVGSTQTDDDKLMKNLLAQIISQYTNQNSTLSSAINLSA